MASTARKSRINATSGKYYDAYRNFGDYYSQTSSAYKVDESKPYANKRPYDYAQRRERLEKAYEQKRRHENEAAEKKLKTARIAAENIQPRPKRKRLNLIKYRVRIDPSKANPKEAYFVMLIVSVGLIGVIASRAMVQDASTRTARLRSALAETRAHSAALYTELYKNYNKVEIERIATEDFDMTYPKPHQEIRVTVPRANYIVQARPNTVPETYTWLYEKMVDLINRNR